MKAIKHLLLALLVLPLSGFAQTYTLTLLQQPTQCGTVYGAGNYESGTNVSVNANPNSYYSFVGWYEGSNMISSERSFTYEMPEHDVTLTARYSYTPTLPGEPEAPDMSDPEPTYTVELAIHPSSAASIPTSVFNQAPGTTIWINPSVNSYCYFTFKEWRNDLDEVVSTERAFTFTVPERNTKLTAYFYYNPSTPADPGSFNSWDPFTGELMILKLSSLQTACDELISADERPLVRKLVVSDPNFNSNDYNISYIRSYLTGVEVVDLKNTKFVYYNSSSLQIPSMKKLILPAGNVTFSTTAFSTDANAGLEEIWIYATTPTSYSDGASVLDKVPATCIIYVPNESVETYKAADYWKSHDIRPMVSEENAVGPDDAAWNDLNQLHKLPFSYTYSGADGGSIEYQVEETGEWQTLCADLENNQAIDTYALAQFVKTRSTHTIDFRVVDGATVTPLPEKRVALIDMGFKTVTVAGSNFYDYGNAIEPAVTVADLSSDRYVVAYTNNYTVGRASALVAGVYPYTISTRTATFDIARLPLPGSVEFVDPEVSLVYNGGYIRPEWQFTDPRNEALVKDTDYTVAWSNSYNAGIQTLTITGKGQFDGSIVYEYEILKGPVLEQAYTYGLYYPETEIIYDGATHGIRNSYAPHTGYSGTPIIEHYDHETGEKLDAAPTEVGEYEGWIGFQEGTNTVYTAPECRIVYTIFDMTDAEWAAIQALSADLATHGYDTGWNLSQKINSLRYSGLTVKKGWVTGVNLPDKSMTGTFPESLYAFNGLKSINLSGNRLSGTFNSETRTLASVEQVNLTGNILSGDLTALAACFPNATAIKVSGNRLSDVSAPLPATVATLEIAGQATGATVDMDYTGSTPPATFYAAIPSIALYDHTTRTFASAPELWLTTSDYTSVAQLPESSWAMKLTGENVEKVSDNVFFTGANGSTLHVLTADNIRFDAAFSFLPGDVNFDRTLSVLDLQGVINLIFDEVATDAPFNSTAADIKADGGVNIFDVTTIVGVLLSNEPAAAPMRRVAASGNDALAFCAGNALLVSSAEPVAAFDITLAGATLPGRLPQLDAAGFSYSVSGSRIVGWSLSGATLPEGITEIATTDGEAMVVNAELSNKGAKAITKSSGNHSALEDVTVEAGDDGQWHNLQGLRIPRPAASGIYIHNNQKILIR